MSRPDCSQNFPRRKLHRHIRVIFFIGAVPPPWSGAGAGCLASAGGAFAHG